MTQYGTSLRVHIPMTQHGTSLRVHIPMTQHGWKKISFLAQSHRFYEIYEKLTVRLFLYGLVSINFSEDYFFNNSVSYCPISSLLSFKCAFSQNQSETLLLRMYLVVSRRY